MSKELFRGIAFDLEGTVVDLEFIHHRVHAADQARAILEKSGLNKLF